MVRFKSLNVGLADVGCLTIAVAKNKTLALCLTVCVFSDSRALPVYRADSPCDILDLILSKVSVIFLVIGNCVLMHLIFPQYCVLLDM